MVKSFHLIKAIYLFVSPKSKGEKYLHDPYSLARVDSIVLVDSSLFIYDGGKDKEMNQGFDISKLLPNQQTFI